MMIIDAVRTGREGSDADFVRLAGWPSKRLKRLMQRMSNRVGVCYCVK